MTENNVKNLFAGFFVLFMIFVMIFIGFSLSGGFKKKPTTTYIANFHSIAGLSDASVVSYKGFDIGRVKNIKINPKNPNLVSVYMDINDDITIYKQTVATLESVGITGQSQIELSLKFDNKKMQLDPIHTTDGNIPEIATMPSQLDSIMTNINGISKSLNEISAKFNNMLSEDNMHKFDNLIESTNILLYNFSNSSIYFNKTLMNFNDTMITAQDSLNKINHIVEILDYDPSTIVRGIKH